MARSISARAISGFVRAVRYSAGTPARSNRARFARPTRGKKQPQCQHDWYFASRKRQRYQGLAVGGLAQRRSILRRDTHRMRAFLGYCGVVDHQHGIAAADQPIRLNKQFRLHRPRIPDPGRNEVVQLIVFAKPKPLRHRLNALTSARTDQPRHVEWTHLSPRLVTQPIHKRLEKASKLFFPIRRPSNHGRPLQSRPPMSHRKTDLGIPCRSKSAKVVLSKEKRPRFYGGKARGRPAPTGAAPLKTSENCLPPK